MILSRFRNRVAGAVWTAVALSAALALSSRWLERLRLLSPERSSVRLVHVTSGADAGPGSLREAIFAADRAEGRARIVIDVPRILVETPLPPLLNPAGIVMEAGRSRAVLDASRLRAGPVLDVLAPNCVIAGLRIERAANEAILIRHRGARLQNVTVSDSDVGVYQADGANDLVVEDSAFERNMVGVQIADAPPMRILNSRFQNHRRAAVWAVAANPPLVGQPTGLDILRNQFAGDYQAIVVFNIPARIERNGFESVHTAAVFVSGSRVVVRNNRMRAGRDFGINAERLDHGIIADNEIDHNCAGGMIVRNSGDTQVSFNRVYANGFGIILVQGKPASPNMVTDNLVAEHLEDGVYVIGGSPILRSNRLLQNRKAGLHLSWVATGDRRGVPPTPLMEANVLSGNGKDEVDSDEYMPQAPETTLTGPVDCSWRLSGDRVQTARAGGAN